MLFEWLCRYRQCRAKWQAFGQKPDVCPFCGSLDTEIRAR